MARTMLLGWDVGAITAEAHANDASPGVVGSVSQESTIIRSGTGSLKLTPGSGAAGYWSPQASVVAFAQRLRFYLRVTTLPATARRVISSNNANLSILLNPSGTLTLRADFGSVDIGTSTVALTDTARWYNIEAGVVAGNGTLRIDGETQVSAATSLTAIGVRFGADDTVAATYTAYVDDAVLDNAAWPGDSKIILLKPISDAQIGSWTGGAGGVSNLFNAVDNTPPTGTATETDATQIESIDGSGDNATDEYRVNLQSYATGGISASATVRAIESLIWHGEDVSTGTKTGSLAIISNPNVGTYDAFTFGADGGALGTFPATWVAQKNATVTDSPTVTISSSPQIAVRKTDAGTRVASVCFIGLKVEYIDRSLAIGRRHRNYIIR